MSNEDFLKEAQEQNFWEVTVDYEELKALRDDDEHFFECEFLPLVQVDMLDMLGEDEYVNWAQTEDTHNYTNRNTGLPIPPDNVAKLLQREIQDPLWWEAFIVKLCKAFMSGQNLSCFTFCKFSFAVNVHC